LLWLVKMADFVRDDLELLRSLEKAVAPSALEPRIRAAFDDASREMSDIFSGVEISFQQSYYQTMAQFKKGDKICIICFEDLELDDSFSRFEATNYVEIFNIPSSVGKHLVVDAMKKRDLPMPEEFNYYELIGKFEGPMRACAKYATVKAAQYVIKTLKSNALEVRGSILGFKPMARHIVDTHLPIGTPCGHIFGGNCLNAWVEVKQKKGEQPGCPYCREPLVMTWKASAEYHKIRKEMSDKIGEGQWYRTSTSEEFLFRLNAIRWHPIYYKEFIPLVTETLINLHTNELADDTLQALDRSLLIMKAVGARFIEVKLFDLSEAQRGVVNDLELRSFYLELENCVEDLRRDGHNWTPGEVEDWCRFAHDSLLDIAYAYDFVTGGRYNDLDRKIDPPKFWDNNALKDRIENGVISNQRWSSECASVADALKEGQRGDNNWLMDRAKILHEGRKKYLIQLTTDLRATYLKGKSPRNPMLYLEDVKYQVETLEKYHEKLAEAGNEVDAVEHGKGMDNKYVMACANMLNRELKHNLAKLKASNLHGESDQAIEYVKHEVESLEKHQKKLAEDEGETLEKYLEKCQEKLVEICNEADAPEHGKGTGNKRATDRAKKPNKERKEQTAKEQKAKKQKASKRKEKRHKSKANKRDSGV
jgi:hypothetical protein